MRLFKFLFALSLFAGVSSLAIDSGTFLKGQSFLTQTQVKEKWGSKPFTAEAFRKGRPQDRAPISYDLIQKKSYIGAEPARVRKELGATSGYFWSEAVPTYIIEDGWAKKKDTWQIVFLLNEKGQVSEVRVHKNCCDTNQ